MLQSTLRIQANLRYDEFGSGGQLNHAESFSRRLSGRLSLLGLVSEELLRHVGKVGGSVDVTAAGCTLKVPAYYLRATFRATRPGHSASSLMTA